LHTAIRSTLSSAALILRTSPLPPPYFRCITAGASAIDIDLFFDEVHRSPWLFSLQTLNLLQDMTLGNKIKLGENVVTALGRMRCPSPLQTHQIRGLDFKAMFPIFQWLVKLVLLTRQERGEQIRKFCALQYALRSFTPTPQDAEDAAFATKAVPSFKKIAGVSPSPVLSFRLVQFLLQMISSPSGS
jgi:hypothetical protein